jgi:predicted nucleotidyltransferase component of viral defense system
MKRPLKGIRNNAILTSAQISLLEEFVESDLSDAFRLTGGTALSAFYLEHRLSEDLDFFSHEKIPFYLSENFLKSLSFVDAISHTKLFDRNIFNLKLKNGTALKTEFTYYPLKNIEAVVTIDGLHVDGFLDLTVNKLCAMADRYETKDYLDVYCALTSANLDMNEMFELAEQKCEVKGIRHILKSRLLQIPEGVENLPLRISVTREDIERFFKARIKEVIINETL